MAGGLCRCLSVSDQGSKMHGEVPPVVMPRQAPDVSWPGYRALFLLRDYGGAGRWVQILDILGQRAAASGHRQSEQVRGECVH